MHTHTVRERARARARTHTYQATQQSGKLVKVLKRTRHIGRLPRTHRVVGYYAMVITCSTVAKPLRTNLCSILRFLVPSSDHPSPSFLLRNSLHPPFTVRDNACPDFLPPPPPPLFYNEKQFVDILIRI